MLNGNFILGWHRFCDHTCDPESGEMSLPTPTIDGADPLPSPSAAESREDPFIEADNISEEEKFGLTGISGDLSIRRNENNSSRKKKFLFIDN